jgi:hypothetical protein
VMGAMRRRRGFEEFWLPEGVSGWRGLERSWGPEYGAGLFFFQVKGRLYAVVAESWLEGWEAVQEALGWPVHRTGFRLAGL